MFGFSGKVALLVPQLIGGDYFSVQGWRKNRIRPDFIAAKRSETNPEDYNAIYVLETKGDQLAGNLDTHYKQQVFALCNELGKKIAWMDLGREFPHRQVQFQVVMEDEWERVIQELFA